MRLLRNMHPHTSSPRRSSTRWVRGDVSLLYSFLIIAVLLLGATTAAMLVSTTIKSARDTADSSQVFYAADSGIERGFFNYTWDVNGVGAPETCTTGTFNMADAPSVSYQLSVSGNPWPSGSCPTLAQIESGRALCVSAIGRARGGLLQRRVRSDTNASLCIP